MIRIDCFLMAAVLRLGMSLAEGSNCDCRCGRYSVCDDVNKLRTDVDLNIAERRKWSNYYNFVHNYHRTWEGEAAWKQDLEVQLNETTDLAHSFLASYRQMEESVQKNIELLQNVQSDLLTRMRNFETSLETLRKDLNYLSNQDENFQVSVTNDISEIKDELLRFQNICSPPCENGGQCMKNVCNCTPSFTGDRCQQVMCSPPCENGGQCMTNNTCQCTPSFAGDRCQQAPCGADFDNGGGNISSLHVWPWMAAVYRNKTSSTEHFCDGSVIHRHFVLTAAECVIGKIGLSVKLGLSGLKEGTHLQEHRVQSVHMHPEFKRSPYNNQDYDIGLLELEEPIPFGPFVRPVCLPPSEILQDETFYQPQSTAKAIYTRDYISSPQTASPTLLNLTILSQEECRSKIKEKDWEKYFPSQELSFCSKRSSAACPLPGSPVMQSRLAEDGAITWTQVGIKNWCGDQCLFSPRLDYLRTWVDATIAASSKR